MSFVTAALIGAGGAIVGGLISSNASKSAANTQANAANQSAQLQKEMFDKQVEMQQPWLNAGQQALNKLIPMSMEYTPFGMRQFQADPGYSFRLSEGMKALERSAAAKGGLLSGATLKGIQRYGQGMASDEYMNAFNRYQTERAARLSPLQSLAGVGQTTAQQLGQAGQQMGQSVGETMTSGAAARASGYVGSANALTGGIGSALNFYQNQQMMNSMMPSQYNYPMYNAPGYSNVPAYLVNPGGG